MGWKATDGRAYLGENVVNEKEYLSAMISFRPEICSGVTPEEERCTGSLMRFERLRRVEDGAVVVDWSCNSSYLEAALDANESSDSNFRHQRGFHFCLNHRSRLSFFHLLEITAKPHIRMPTFLLRIPNPALLFVSSLFINAFRLAF